MEYLKKEKPQSTAWDVIKEFWKVSKLHKWLLFLDIFALVISSIIQIFTPLYYKHFFDILTAAGPPSAAAPQLVHTIVIILILNAAIWLFYRTGTFFHNRYQTYAMAKLRQSSFAYMIDHSYTFFANNFTGSLVQRISRFARAFERLSDRLIWNIIPLAITLIGISIVVWQINPVITLVILGCTAVFLAFNYFFSLWKLNYDVRAAAIDSETTAVLSDDITNHNTIALFTGVTAERARVDDVTQRQARATNFAWNLGGIVDAFQSGLLFIVEFLLFYIAIKFWLNGTISVGAFVLIQIYFISLGGRLWDFTRIVRDIYEGFADSKEMVDILKLPHEIKDLPQAKQLAVAGGEIHFKDIIFSFNETRTVLDKINLTIHSGEKVALIGPSGAGKSTFVRLLLRFYETTGGSIFVDSQDIKYATQESLRENISLVPQDPVLFHRTLKENIRYGKKDATDEEIERAAKLAHCDEFINNLPLGYETYVGERGIKLSGGERQRVAIARAILKNAPILILDEATSSLDSHSEALIQDALDTLMKGKTVIVIAHRLSTIRKMDRIIVIDNGKILEEGTHESLLASRESLYAKLWKLQAGGFLREESEEELEQDS